MSPYALSILLSSLSVGTMITIISDHWFLAWMGLEINTLAIIPLMSKAHHPRATEATTKYFLIQASASALVLFSTMTNAWLTGNWTITGIENWLSSALLTSALAMKLGIAPFHLWLPDILQGLDLLTGLILSTWQKLAPMILMVQINHELNTSLLTIMAILSILIGGWGGLNQIQLRKILAFSSIAHLGWMMLVMLFSPNLALFNLIIYLFMTASMFLMLMVLKSTNINKLSTSWTKNPTLAAIMMLTLMSLGGLPPMSGFVPKMLIMMELISQNMTAIATTAAISSMLSLFFYLRLSYTLSLTTSPNITNSHLTWRLTPFYMMLIPAPIILSTMIMPIMSTLYMLI
uniref:NADH-ubiquinone oxidoreductase chain 2 n=1 Tax=Necturus beyeri TaxID=324346 RepID=A0A2U9QLB2_9SALA|nr:NADH dehydrogenase subunit 2 [Necturus beyeri]AWU49751.1 NADH dehydrogenase subunit 2 [Necturus beyeri]AWU49776.1 NADH dehydrogenase subunit 2 [Necturus beyeri]AWU49777.1 NADH dehydrogenase subunit 2 [Necturus beyeri]AWU49779.1 NADH dehydrogenase subunit 2 [Necturus beyeri]